MQSVSYFYVFASLSGLHVVCAFCLTSIVITLCDYEESRVFTAGKKGAESGLASLCVFIWTLSKYIFMLSKRSQ